MSSEKPESKVYRNNTMLAFNSSKTDAKANALWQSASSLVNILEKIGINSIRSFDVAQTTNSWNLTVGKDCCYSPQQPTTDVTKGI